MTDSARSGSPPCPTCGVTLNSPTHDVRFFSDVTAERDRLRAGISWARGMCSDGEPVEKIDAYLGELLDG